MIETLAFVTIVVTQGVEGAPAGATFTTTEPVACIESANAGIKLIEDLGGKADAFCDYTYAPATSLRPKARGQ